MEDLLQVGVITSTHGIRGEVKVFPTTDDNNRFKKLKDCFVEFRGEMHPMKASGCKFFKNMTRKTPVDYLVAYRVEKASRKLLSTDMSVTDIAFAAGFNDLSYFIKTFKKLKGKTPADFRKQ